MAVLGRLLIASAERIDLSDALSIDSYTAGDFKFLLKGLVGDGVPLVLQGFEVINPGAAIGSQNISISIADSVVLYPGSKAGPFFHGLPEGNPNAQPLVPELRKNATNFVYLTLTTFETSKDTRAFWDPDLDGGAGGEFTQDINTESVLGVEVNVSTSSFPDNTIPICEVVVGPTVIQSIKDCRDMMFRLGSGGLSPDPFSRYNFRSDPSSLYKRHETPVIMSSALDPNPFEGADKNIRTLKEWMDAVMTKLAELGGTAFWYEDASTFNLINLFADALGSKYKSKGEWQHSSSTPGQITWSEDFVIKSISDQRDVIIRSGSKTLADEEVMYIDVIRGADINTGNVSVNWFNGFNFVNGIITAFQNLTKGDWVKKKNDADGKYLRVEEFYAAPNLAGGVTTAALAQSIKLSAVYAGITEVQRGVYTKGVYTSGDVQVGVRNDGTLNALGGELHWFAIRSDTIMNVSSIATTTLSGTIVGTDGSKAVFTAGAAHGLVNGDRVTITGAPLFNGTYVVEVSSTTAFYFETTAVGTNAGASAFYATGTTTTRSTADGLLLESATHGFKDDDSIVIASAGGFNGNYQVKTRSATTFTIPVGSAIVSVSSGTATLPRVIVRSEFGTSELVQGEAIGIGSPDTANILAFIGMGSLSETHPTYGIPTAYNTLSGTANYNSSQSENLTSRISKLTAMMADKAQDKTIKYMSQGMTSITNTTNGAAQELTFNPSGATLTIEQPGSPGNATVALPDSAPGISLLANQVAYVSISRKAATSPSIIVANCKDVPVDENIFVIASRLTAADCWAWDGTALGPGTTPTPVLGAAQDRNTKLVKGGAWSWNLGTTTLTWTLDAFLEIPGVANTRNRIPAGSIASLTADGQCLYVSINRTPGAPAVLAISTADIASVPNTFDTLIIARRVDNAVMVGNGTILLIDGESKELESGLSIQNRALIGSGVTEATSNPGYAARGAVNRITSDSEGALDAIARHDAEFDKYFGQLRMIAKTAGNKRRVRITGSDRIVFTGETLAQELSSLRMFFTGAEIDFQTGIIYGGDATLPLSTDFVSALGVNFTPATLGVSQYLWYSVACNPAGTNADNSINIQFNVIAGSTSAATPTLANKPALGGVKKLGYVVVKDNGSGGSGTILTFDDPGFTLPAASAQSKIAQLGVGGSGSGTGAIKVKLHDPLSLTLPTGVVVVDAVTVNPDDLVLFSALTSGANKIYKAVGTIGNITSWQSQFVFNGSDSPSDGDLVIVLQGNSFADQLGKFTGTAWVFNDKVRYFNGADYWEVSALQTSTLADNSTGNVFTVAYAASENIIVDYSIMRGSTKETGTLHVTTDGSVVAVTTSGAYIGLSGVTFSGDISGANLRLRFTTTATGSAATMKYYIRRWSNAAGGPGGPPSYSGGGGGGGGSAAGSSGDIQFNSSGNLAGNSNFQIDTVDLSMNFNGMRHTALASTGIADNVASPTALFTFNAAANRAAILEYSIVRGGTYRTARLLIANDGVITAINGDHVETSPTGVTISADISGANVRVLYTSTATGSGGTFKYALRRWA